MLNLKQINICSGRLAKVPDNHLGNFSFVKVAQKADVHWTVSCSSKIICTLLAAAQWGLYD